MHITILDKLGNVLLAHYLKLAVFGGKNISSGTDSHTVIYGSPVLANKFTDKLAIII